jgi:RNA polymerase sigma factor (TIGR02999 family)
VRSRSYWKFGETETAKHPTFCLLASPTNCAAWARPLLHNERPDHTLQSAALVHEVYLRVVGVSPPQQGESRTHFFAIAAQFMRQILVGYARRHKAAKWGGSVCKLSLEDAMATPRRARVDIVALDDALLALARINERQSGVVELRFFAGLSLNEISKALEIALATEQRNWKAARACLPREISRGHRV